MSYVIIALIVLLMAETLFLLRYACRKWFAWSNDLARYVMAKVEECEERKREVRYVPLPPLRVSDSNAKMAKLRDADNKLAGALSETYIYALFHMTPAKMRRYDVEVRLVERKEGEA